MVSLLGCSGNIPAASSLVSGEVTLSWNEVPGAIAYNVYGSTSPGVTVLSGSKFRNVPNPLTITQLQPNKTYYFVVTVVLNSGESKESREISYTAIANTKGSIQFGDILGHSEPDDVTSESENLPATSPSGLKPNSKRNEQLSLVPSTRSSTQIIVCFGDSLTFGTGASKGIGQAICAELAQSGYRIVVNYNSDEKGALNTLEMVRQAGSDGKVIQFDVSNFDQTQRAVDNFPISGLTMPSAFIRALALVKYGCADANLKLGLIDKKKAHAIQAVAEKIIAGEYLQHFPVDIFQTGSGTSTTVAPDCDVEKKSKMLRSKCNGAWLATRSTAVRPTCCAPHRA